MGSHAVCHSFDQSFLFQQLINGGEDARKRVKWKLLEALGKQLKYHLNIHTDEMEDEKEQLKQKADDASKKRLEELEKKKIWHAGNMCEVLSDELQPRRTLPMRYR